MTLHLEQYHVVACVYIYIAGGKSQLLLSPIQVYSCMPRYGTCSVSSPVDFASAGSSALSV